MFKHRKTFRIELKYIGELEELSIQYDRSFSWLVRTAVLRFIRDAKTLGTLPRPNEAEEPEHEIK